MCCISCKAAAMKSTRRVLRRVLRVIQKAPLPGGPVTPRLRGVKRSQCLCPTRTPSRSTVSSDSTKYTPSEATGGKLRHGSPLWLQHVLGSSSGHCSCGASSSAPLPGVAENHPIKICKATTEVPIANDCEQTGSKQYTMIHNQLSQLSSTIKHCYTS